MASNNSFLDVLGTIDGKVQRMSTEVKTIRQLATDGHMEDAYAVSLRLAKIAERSTLLTRILPVYSGKPTAYMDVEAVIRGTVPVKVSITDMGWFYVNLPALLPKKEFNSRSYVRGYLFPALNQFFADKDPLHYEDAVIIFRHVYCRDRPERRRRDHDNIEVNCVADTIALFVLLDDSPSVCSHYYCSAAGDTDCTEVFVIPYADFPLWPATNGAPGKAQNGEIST